MSARSNLILSRYFRYLRYGVLRAYSSVDKPFIPFSKRLSKKSNYEDKTFRKELSLTSEEILKKLSPFLFATLEDINKCDRELTIHECHAISRVNMTGSTFFIDYLARRELRLAFLSYAKFIMSSHSAKVLLIALLKNLSTLYAKRLVEKKDFQDLMPFFNESANSIPNEKLKTDINSYLSLLNDNCTPESGNFVQIVMRAIKNADVEIARKAHESNSKDSIHENEWLQRSFEELFSRDGVPKKEMLKIYFDRIAEFKEPLSLEFYLNHVEPLIKSTPGVKFEKDEYGRVKCLNMNPKSRECPSCKALWEPMHKINASERDQLFSAFEKKYTQLFSNFQSGSSAELLTLRKMITQHLQKPQFSGRKLVIDSLNLVSGRIRTDLPEIYQFVMETQKEYPGIVIISRSNPSMSKDPIYRGRMNHLLNSNVALFHADRRSYDDIFTLFAALWLGDDSFILSNDEYNDIAGSMHQLSMDTYKLFTIWLNSILVRRIGRIDHGDVRFIPVPVFNRSCHKVSNSYHLTAVEGTDDLRFKRESRPGKMYHHYCIRITDDESLEP